MTPLHDQVRAIINNPGNHHRTLCIAIFSLPAERGQSYTSRQNMVRAYGSRPEIAGLTFTTLRSTDDNEEYLTCHYDPDAIVDGEYETFRAGVEEKRLAKQANRKARTNASH